MNEFKKVIGYEAEKLEMYRILDTMNNPEKYKKLGVETSKGLLLFGKPGVGKTLMAKSFIKAANRKAFTIRKNIPNGKFVEHIEKTFAKAIKEAPSIVFLDDMDKFANGDEHHRNSEEYVTVQSCIDKCQGKKVFVLATANDLDNVPRSLLRKGRFDTIIEMENPTRKDAELIVKHYLKNKICDETVISYIATNFSQNVRFLEAATTRLLFYSIDKERIDLKTAIDAFKGVSMPHKNTF